MASGYFIRVGVHHVKPAMTDRFKEMMGEAVAALAKAESPIGFDTFEVQFGEGSFVVVAGAESAAAFYSAPSTGELLNKALGTEGTATMVQEWRDCITKYETGDYTTRPDLSYVPMEGGYEE